jgi:hypothetical protein
MAIGLEGCFRESAGITVLVVKDDYRAMEETG